MQENQTYSNYHCCLNVRCPRLPILLCCSSQRFNLHLCDSCCTWLIACKENVSESSQVFWVAKLHKLLAHFTSSFWAILEDWKDKFSLKLATFLHINTVFSSFSIWKATYKDATMEGSFHHLPELQKASREWFYSWPTVEGRWTISVSTRSCQQGTWMAFYNTL